MIDLLGKSQTFFGVLATVVVLCIFKGGNNFIFQILEEIRERLRERVKSLTVSVELESTRQRLEKKLSVETNPLKIKSYGELMSKLSKLKMQLTLMDMVAFFAGYDEKYERIKKSDEMLRSPFYTCLYIFIIFLFDEYLRCEICPAKEMMFTAVSFVTLFSFIYWMLIWCNYIRRNLCDKERGLCLLPTKNRYMVVIVLAVVCLLIYFASLFGCHILLANDNVDMAKYLFRGSFVVPCIASGCYFVHTHPKSNNGYYFSLLFHVVGMLGFSIVFSGVLYLLMNWEEHFSLLLISDSMFEQTKLWIFLFTIFNGLLLPFFCPLFCFYWVYRCQARAQVVKTERNAKKILEEINDEIGRVKL